MKSAICSPFLTHTNNFMVQSIESITDHLPVIVAIKEMHRQKKGMKSSQFVSKLPQWKLLSTKCNKWFRKEESKFTTAMICLTLTLIIIIIALATQYFKSLKNHFHCCIVQTLNLSDTSHTFP
jgi:hypothetical protein